MKAMIAPLILLFLLNVAQAKKLDASPTVVISNPNVEIASTKTKDSTKIEKVKKQASKIVAAKSGESQSWWQLLLTFLIKLLDLIIEPVLIAFGYVLTRKFGIKVERDSIEWIVSKAVGFGEQAAKNALKAGKPYAGPEILSIAVKYGDALLIQTGLMKKWGGKLDALIEAKLGEIEVLKSTPKTKPNGR